MHIFKAIEELFNIRMLFERYGTVAYVIIFFVIFAESGLFFGFFLPGDSLLFTAGFLASQHLLDLRVLAILCFVAAVLGDSVGYAFGRKYGRRLFHKKDSFLFSHENLEKAEKFYEVHGKKTIVLARFTPIVRTFAPIVAGIGNMEYNTFISYNVIGGFLWAVGLTVAGYYLGRIIPNVDKYLLPIVILIVVLSLLPSVYHVLSDEKNRAGIKNAVGKRFQKKDIAE